jgi:hypothetical protein
MLFSPPMKVREERRISFVCCNELTLILCACAIQSKQGDVKKAIAQIKKTLKWRKEFGVDRILKSFTDEGDEEMRKILLNEAEPGKIYVRGYDAEGRALMYMTPARENTNHEENNMRHLVWNLEKAIACTAKKSTEICGGEDAPLEKVNLVIDYDGFKLKNAPPLSTSKYTLDILQRHYPERMHRAYVLNPPLVFKIFWNIVKNFVDPVTKTKIVFCTGDKGIAKNLVSTVSAPEKLEPRAGGKVPVRDFDSKEYLHLPFDTSFDD